MKNKNSILFSLSFFTSYVALAIVSTIITPYMKELGYSDADVGMFFSLGSVLGMFLQLYLGKISEQKKRIKIYIIILALIAILFNYFLFSNKIHLYLILINGTFLFGSLKSMLALMDTWVFNLNKETRRYFGIVRACGVFGWSICLAFFIPLITSKGYSFSIVIFNIVMLITLIACKITEDINTIAVSHKEKIPFKALLNKDFILYNIIFFLLFSILNSEDMVLSLKMLSIGGSTEDVALRGSIQALIELPLFMFSYRILDKFKINRLFPIAIILLILKSLFYFYAFNIEMMMIGTIFQFTFPLLHLASKHYIYIASPDNGKVYGQMVSTAFFLSFSGIVAPSFLGLISDIWDINTALLALASFSLLALVLLMLLNSKTIKKD